MTKTTVLCEFCKKEIKDISDECICYCCNSKVCENCRLNVHTVELDCNGVTTCPSCAKSPKIRNEFTPNDAHKEPFCIGYATEDYGGELKPECEICALRMSMISCNSKVYPDDCEDICFECGRTYETKSGLETRKERGLI
jgi:hypothetical protein